MQHSRAGMVRMRKAEVGNALLELAASSWAAQSAGLRECATRGLEVFFADAARQCGLSPAEMCSLVSFLHSPGTFSEAATCFDALTFLERGLATPVGCRLVIEWGGAFALRKVLGSAVTPPRVVCCAAAAVLRLAAFWPVDLFTPGMIIEALFAVHRHRAAHPLHYAARQQLMKFGVFQSPPFGRRGPAATGGGRGNRGRGSRNTARAASGIL